jgi:hypothetical protein
MAPSVSAPNAMRPNATSVGAKCSSPMSMNRNEAPQVSATPESISQSAAAKCVVSWSSSASRRVATLMPVRTIRARFL